MENLFEASNQVRGEKSHKSSALDSRAMLKELDRCMAEIERQRFAASPCLEVSYENFVTDRAAESKRLLEFLGVDAQVELTSDLVKINPGSPSDLVENHHEVRATLRVTVHVQFLY